MSLSHPSSAGSVRRVATSGCLAVLLSTTMVFGQSQPDVSSSPAPAASPAPPAVNGPVTPSAPASPAPDEPLRQALGRTAEDEKDEAPAATRPGPAPSTAAANPDHRPYLGIAVTPISAALRAQLGKALPADAGAIIHSVERGTAAANAGIQQWDIVLGINGTSIRDARDLVARVRELRVGQRITLSILREGQKRDVAVSVGSKPRSEWSSDMAVDAPEPVDAWDEVRNLKVEKTRPEQLSVEFTFEDDAGVTMTRRYSGSRSEIQRQVRADSQLSPARRKYILDSLRRVSQDPGSEAMQRRMWYHGEPPAHRMLREHFPAWAPEWPHHGPGM